MLDAKLLENILAWKKRWGVIHKLELPSEPNAGSCYYRSLTPLEYNHLQELIEKNPKGVDWDSLVVSVGLLYPNIDDLQLPGTINILSTNILSISNPTEETLSVVVEETRKWAANAAETNFSIGLCMSICNIYPSVNLVDLLNLSTESLLQITALIELVTKTQIIKIGKQSNIKTASINKEHSSTVNEHQQSIDKTSTALLAAIDAARKKLKP